MWVFKKRIVWSTILLTFFIKRSNEEELTLSNFDNFEQNVPDSPSNLQVFAKNDNSAVVYWNPPRKGSYSNFKLKLIKLLKMKYHEDNKSLLFDNIKTTSYTIEDLIPGATYQIYAYTVFKNKESVGYATRKFTTIPSTPGKGFVWFRNETSLLFLWQPPFPPAIFTHYVASINPPDGLENDILVESDGEPPGPAQAHFKNLVPGRTYNISIRTLSEDKVSLPATGQYSTVPLKPINLTVLNNTITSHSFSVEWEPPKGKCDFDKYQVQVKNSTTTFDPVIIQKNEPLIYKTKEDLYPGMTYTIILKSISGRVTSWPVTANVTLTPDSPSNLQVFTKNGKSAVIFWNPPRNGSYSNFKLKLIKLSKMKINEDNKSLLFDNIKTTSYTIEDLIPGATYQVYVYTIFENKESVGYATRNFTTIPNTPGRGLIWFRNETTLLALWQPPYPPAIYTHYIASINPPDALKSDVLVQKDGEPPGPAQAVFKNLVPGRTYEISIRTLSEDKVSLPTTDQFLTVPLKPTNLTVLNNTITSYSFSVEWKPPKGKCEFDKYQVQLKNSTKTFDPVIIQKNAPLIYKTKEDLYPGITYTITLNSVSRNVTSWPVTTNVTLNPLPIVINLNSLITEENL